MRMIIAAVVVVLSGAAQAQQAKLTYDDFSYAKTSSIDYVMCSGYFHAISTRAFDDGAFAQASALTEKSDAYRDFIVGLELQTNGKQHSDRLASTINHVREMMHGSVFEPSNRERYDAMFTERCRQLYEVAVRGTKLMRGN